MLQSVRALVRLPLHAKDGKVGKAVDFYFDDASWKIRGVVVNTGGWLSRHFVLLRPEVFSPPEASAHHLTVSLTRQQVRQSASVETVETLSRHEEKVIHDRYGETPFEQAAHALGSELGKVSHSALEIAEAEEPESSRIAEQRPQLLRSTQEIIGYRVEAEDGPSGIADDFIIDDDDWTIHYLVTDMKDVRIPNPKVLVPTSWVELMSWSDSRVYLKVGREKVRASQKYDVYSHSHLEKLPPAMRR